MIFFSINIYRPRSLNFLYSKSLVQGIFSRKVIVATMKYVQHVQDKNEDDEYYTIADTIIYT